MNRFHRLDVLTHWFTEYLERNEYRPRTIRDYHYELLLFRRFLKENTEIADIDELTPATLPMFVSYLYARELSAATIHHKLSVLNSFFGALYEENKIYVDLHGVLHRPQVGRKLPGGMLSEKEIKDIMDYIDRTAQRPDIITLIDAVELRDCAMVDLLYGTGMRRNELTALTLDNLRYDDGVVHIRGGKGDKDRVVPLGKSTAVTLKRYAQAARPILLGRIPCEYFFASRRAGRIGDYSIRQAVIRVTRTAGVNRHVKVHDLRHSCATHLLNNGADIRYVQELLGHQSLSSTQIYTHVAIDKLKHTHRKHHPRESGRAFDFENAQ